ncbi:MAG: hypothetical protein FJ379_05105 [Verrucomicrobia bacterium]|nr:hypothetical protein [Verrucomicrobiota bacterium]
MTDAFPGFPVFRRRSLPGSTADPLVHDECLEGSGRPRPHWRGLLESLGRLGTAELSARRDEGNRIIREHGITYNVYGDPKGSDRPWDLDLVPLVLPAAEWRTLERGLIQRSRLLNLVLSDLYVGTQRLLLDGFVPPELIYSNPGFLRPCRGIPCAREAPLHLAAVDLVRSPAGQWLAFADRTSSPSGTGYAHENRTVLSRILPDELTDAGVRRLGPFFNTQRSMLESLAPRGGDNPGIVLLTPGPLNATYFEHAYLARHLGIPLVEGADLTVRNERVCLKTLDGLQPVDVILRRIDDGFCDPLELRAESVLGIPGLVQAARSGNVTVANALGSSLIESPAFLAFLGPLCRHLLSEDPILPSVTTWWCGVASDLRHVLDRLDDLVIKPAFGRRRGQIWFGHLLDSSERSRLRELLRARPREFIAQECMSPSSGPIWSPDGFDRRSVLLRTFVATNGSSFSVMPGGLTRVAASAEDPLVSMQRGAGSKDTWVLSSPEDSEDVGPRTTFQASVDRRLLGLPSRAADCLFWLGRYTERLEQRLRILRCVLGLVADQNQTGSVSQLSDLNLLVQNLGILPPEDGEDSEDAGDPNLTERILDWIYGSAAPGSIQDLMGRIRHNASAVRDRFSGDTWRILGRLAPGSSDPPVRQSIAHALGMIQDLILNLAAFNGLEMENMTRGPGWRFLDSGRRLERGTAVVGLVTATAFIPGPSDVLLGLLLEIADSVMTHRRRYFSSARWPDVLEILIREVSNPRSLAFQLAALRNHLDALAGELGVGIDDRWVVLIEGLQTRIGAADFDQITPCPDASCPEALVGLMETCSQGLAGLSDDLNNRYFSHTLPRIS